MKEYPGWRMLGINEKVKVGDGIFQITDVDEWHGAYKSPDKHSDQAIISPSSNGYTSSYILGSYYHELRVFRKNQLFKNNLSPYFAAPAPLP